MNSNLTNQMYYSQYNYGNLKKREAKAINKMETSPSSLRTRWKSPIKKQEINLFYSQYKPFIDGAKDYRKRVLGLDEEPHVEPPKRYESLINF